MAQVTQTQIDEQQGEGSGNDVRLIINALFDAVVTKNSGPTPPPDPRPFLEWFNTESNTLLRRDADNIAWQIIQSFDREATPTTTDNELSDYPPGSEWYTTDARAFVHQGGGIWAELGEAQAASLFAPTLGVLGGRRFALEDDTMINSVVMGGPRFALGASAPTPIADRHTFGLIPSIRFPISALVVGGEATDPQVITHNLFPYLQFTSTTTGFFYFDFPIMTAPTFLLLNVSHFLSAGSVGSLTWSAATALLGNMGAITFGSDATRVLTATSALDGRQTSQILLASAGAVIGDVLRVRVRRSAGTAGTILLSDVWIEQNP